jgi:hypothetical protein
VKAPQSTHGWAGATAFIVALFLSAGWAISMTAAALDDDVSDAGIQLLTGLGGVMAGAVAGYLGAAAALVWERRHEHPDSEDDPTGTV